MAVIGRVVNGKWVSETESTPEDKKRLRQMLESKQPPMSNTDREFWHGRWESDNNPTGIARRVHAEKQGISTTGKFYHSGLAEYPLDPRAWIDSKDDIKRICEERGWGCQGQVNVKPRDDVEPEMIAVDPQIVKDEVDAIIDHHPEPQSINREELTHEITEKRKPSWAK